MMGEGFLRFFSKLFFTPYLNQKNGMSLKTKNKKITITMSFWLPANQTQLNESDYLPYSVFFFLPVSSNDKIKNTKIMNNSVAI